MYILFEVENFEIWCRVGIEGLFVSMIRVLLGSVGEKECGFKKGLWILDED